MKNHLVPLVLVVIAILFLDPLMLLMPTMAIYAAMAGLFILFALYATAIWQERAEDEREYLHRAYAGRVAYLCGAGVLVVGIIYQAIALHDVDPWLILGLAVTVLAKSLSLRHIQSKN